MNHSKQLLSKRVLLNLVNKSLVSAKNGTLIHGNVATTKLAKLVIFVGKLIFGERPICEV
jgi:hypothetical protein